MISSAKKYINIINAALHEQRAKRAEQKFKGRRNPDELAFLPAALEIADTPAPALSRTIITTICIFFSIAIGWSIVGKVDIIATAQGKIIPSERVKVVQPTEVGIVRSIHVRDGSRIKKGDILIELDPTTSVADRKKILRELISVRAEKARLSAHLSPDPVKNFTPPAEVPKSLVELQFAYLQSEIKRQEALITAMEAEIEKADAESKTIKAEITRLTHKIPIWQERWDGARRLHNKGVLSKLNFAKVHEDFIEIKGQLDVQKNKLRESFAKLRFAKARLAQIKAEFNQTIQSKLTEVRRRESALAQELVKASERMRLHTLVAPVDGFVQQLSVHTVGGVVTPAQTLMQIVPAGTPIEIEAMVLNKDIGFVNRGQKAELKIESFPFTKYGTIEGKVRQVYADAVAIENMGLTYPARISMAKTSILNNDRYVDLTPGMAVTVEIKTGKRRFIDYILAPLQEYQSESMRER